DRGFPIAIAEFGADHLVALALLDVGDRRQIGAGLSTLGRLVTNIRLETRGRVAPHARSMTRGFHIACAHLPALGLVGPEQFRPAPASERCRELPRQIDGGADTAVYAEPAGRNH